MAIETRAMTGNLFTGRTYDPSQKVEGRYGNVYYRVSTHSYELPRKNKFIEKAEEIFNRFKITPD